ncbi:hypothetical protein O6H91_17G078200 [Diphasiastrum complanatum]|uniref:Uncharacterized protein n=1 Tax=Diphasiastrum complanatum TaxID=34168 RepID=A0ACC2B898_DIPCM|nr:hypothetical protein O6H91_17G078200 [Diphasiastrum complanatum]
MDIDAESQHLEEVVADLEKLASSLRVDDENVTASPATIIEASPYFDGDNWRRHAAPTDSELSLLLLQENAAGYSEKLVSASVDQRVNRSASVDQRVNRSDPGNANVEDERSRLLVHYVGGSLTFLLQIALLAWGVRQLRSVLARRRQMRSQQLKSNSMLCRPVDFPKFASLSPGAVQKLVELYAAQHLLIDVRCPEAFTKDLLPLDHVINIPEAELITTLELLDNMWGMRFPMAKKPNKNDLLVFLSTRGHRAERAALMCADLGYNGDAVATILQMAHDNSSKISASGLRVIDVRRHDERALYGHIPGSVHLPVEEWPKALAIEELVWKRNYHFLKIGHDDVVILYSRKNKRASWAFQLAKDAGIHRCYVYKQGTFGWRLDPIVLAYDSYDSGDAPPEPTNFTLETIDLETAELELQQARLLSI